VIHEAAASRRAHQARADAGRRRHDDRGHRQLERAQEALGQLRSHGRGGRDRASEVAAQQVPEIGGVLHGQGIVQPPAIAQLVDDLVGGEVAGQQACGIAGDEPHDGEHAEADRE
jgi:hypothetical protein